MKTLLMTATVSVASGLGMPATAFEDMTFGNAAIATGGALNVTIEKSEDASTYGYLDGTLTFERAWSGLTFGAELYASLEYDDEADGDKLYIYDDPYIDPGLWLEGERFGYLAYSYTSSAIGEHCIEAPSAGDNFGHSDHLTVGTCPSWDSLSTLFYRTPELTHGLKFAVSYMAETALEHADEGEAAEGVSAALIYDQADRSGAAWNGSFGFEKVLEMKGGGAKPTSWQAGLSREANGWAIGIAANLTVNGDGTRDKAFGLGVQRQVNDHLRASIGYNRSESRATGAELDENSMSVLAAWHFVPDEVILDGGVWFTRSDSLGIGSNDTTVAIGFSYYF